MSLLADARYYPTQSGWETALKSDEFIGEYLWTDGASDPYTTVKVAYGIHLLSGDILAVMQPPGEQDSLQFYAFYYDSVGFWRGFPLADHPRIISDHFADLVMERML